MLPGGECLDVGPGLDEDRASGVAVDAGDGRQQVQLLVPRLHLLVDPLRVGRDALLERVMLPEQVGEHEAVVGAQLQAERFAEAFQLARNVTGERGENVLALRTARQTVEDLAPVQAEDVGEDAADARPGAVDDLLHPVAHGRALLDQNPALTAQRTQLPERLGRNMGRRAKPELAHAGQPHAVGNVGFSTLELLDLARMHQDRLDPRRLQRRKRRPASKSRSLP